MDVKTVLAESMGLMAREPKKVWILLTTHLLPWGGSEGDDPREEALLPCKLDRGPENSAWESRHLGATEKPPAASFSHLSTAKAQPYETPLWLLGGQKKQDKDVDFSTSRPNLVHRAKRKKI